MKPRSALPRAAAFARAASLPALLAGAGCAATPEVNITVPLDDGGDAASSLDAASTGDVVATEGAAPLDAPSADGANPTSCPTTPPDYANACCGPLPCSGNDCTTATCGACTAACDAAHPVCCTNKNQPGVRCISVNEAMNQGC